MRADANRIALLALRTILDAATPARLKVNDVDVECTLKPRTSRAWPKVARDLDPSTDGQWPSAVEYACKWEGGDCAITMSAEPATGPRYAGEVSLKLACDNQQIVWINICRAIGDTPDNQTVKPEAWVQLTKHDEGEAGEKLMQVMRSLVTAAGLPIGTQSRMLPFEIQLPSGAIEPSGELAARRVLHLGLIKLDFMSRGKRGKARGKPLVDVSAFIGPVADVVEEEDSTMEPVGRQYWAGGFRWGDSSKLEEFVQGSFWQLGYAPTSEDRPAKQAWSRFHDVKLGDWFAIKGYGGTHDLNIHYVGEVTAVDAVAGRLGLRKLDLPLFKGKAPSGAGAGNWFDSIVPITRADAIRDLFGLEVDIPVSRNIPLNLILFGPPGTGKTYSLQQDYLPAFRRKGAEVRAIDTAAETVAKLGWFETVALALHQLGGRAKVDQLIEHELVRAKYALAAPNSPLRQVVWSYLGQHAVESSETVRQKRRARELIFDKDEDSTWRIATPLQGELAALADAIKRQTTSGFSDDFIFTTFHQSYAYEDFVEGIRPRLVREADEDSDAPIAYELQDGIFTRAARAALRLSSFSGTLDEICRLPKEQRARAFDGAKPFAVFIDEINRGNVSRVFGELITLLEEDKRLGAENEVIVTLPYSRTLFGVPKNLHVIGTMNTADRSIDALDTALRRRFAFRELSPKPELLSFPMEGDVDLEAMLRTINARLEKLCGRDHCIGHAHFLPLEDVPTVSRLTEIMSRSIVPLLQEYFFGDLGKIGLVLGREFIRRRNVTTTLADFDHDDRETLEERPTYELIDLTSLTSLSYRRIYESIAT